MNRETAVELISSTDLAPEIEAASAGSPDRRPDGPSGHGSEGFDQVAQASPTINYENFWIRRSEG